MACMAADSRYDAAYGASRRCVMLAGWWLLLCRQAAPSTTRLLASASR